MLISIAIDNLADEVAAMSQQQLKTPSKEDLHRILLDIFNHMLDTAEILRTVPQDGSNPWFKTTNRDDALQKFKNERKGWSTPYDYAREARRDLRQNERLAGARLAHPFFNRYGLAPIADDIKSKVFDRMVLAVYASAEQFNAERDFGIYKPAIFPFARNAKEALPHSPLEAWERQTLSAVSERYKKYKLPEVGNSMLKKITAACRLFTDLIGDMPYQLVKRQDASKFRDQLDRLPRLYAQSPLFKGMRPSQAIRHAAELRRQLEAGEKVSVEGKRLKSAQIEAVLETLDPVTINSHITTLHGFFKWLKKDGLLDGENPFTEIGYSKKRLQKIKKKSKSSAPWPADLQRKLFSRPRWTGFDSLNNTHKPGRLIVEDYNFWAPIVSIFTGMRMEEILQLWTNDIMTIDGIPCIDVNEDIRKGKQLKTLKSSPRLIPVHSELINIGFLDYVAAAMKARSRLLFPTAQRSPMENDKIGRLGTYYTKAFAAIGDKIEAPEEYDFHALRNTFYTALEAKNKNETPFPAQFLMGHLNNKNAQTYGDFRQPKTLKELVEKVKPEIDFSHLYPANQKRRYDFKEHPSRANDK